MLLPGANQQHLNLKLKHHKHPKHHRLQKHQQHQRKKLRWGPNLNGNRMVMEPEIRKVLEWRVPGSGASPKFSAQKRDCTFHLERKYTERNRGC
ncbi:GM13687 [Drosophila sechellia]|uniref:GM13687 n=1 Tax=Drosophila sechellia TaxID=7238 RepID=B4IJP5_DROSE|nr:GM13687 [Drosophila sechellia]